jgi:hypothetical protein
VSAPKVARDLAGDNGSAFSFQGEGFLLEFRYAHAGGLQKLVHLLERYAFRTDSGGFLQNLGNVTQSGTDSGRGSAERSTFHCADSCAL